MRHCDQEDESELAQLWYEFVTLGPPLDRATFSPLDFCEWLNTEPDNTYGLPEVEHFLAGRADVWEVLS